jgi:murein DD-endopeptidase MepM/ murein hydrolase activator NlpD
MDNILLNISEIYSEILKTKSLIKEQQKKVHIFGGASCKWGGGPDGHASFNPKTWQVNRAWDIMGSDGTSVYAIDNGVITRVEQKKHNPETKEYGYSIEMNTEGDKIYYTHLSSIGPNVKQGQKISQGDLLGKIGKPAEDPNWPVHVHVAIERGNIQRLVDAYCNVILKKGSGTMTGNTGSTSASTDNSLYSTNKSFAELVLGDKYKFESTKEMKSINEVTMMAPVPIKPGFKGNFSQVRKGGYIHPGTDIPIPSGTPVKSPLSGKVVGVHSNRHPCGGTIDIEYSDGFWSRFCHMKQINVKVGDLVNRGDVVGLSGGGANDYGKGRSSGPHLHFTLKKNGQKVDPVHYMEKFNASDITYDSSIKSDLGSTSDQDSIEGEVDYSSGINALNSPDTKKTSSGPLYGKNQFADLLTKTLGLTFENEIKEEKIYGDFGKSQQLRYGSITLPKEKNDKIKSPVMGVITRGRYNPSCVNQISISHDMDGEKYTLEYCGISKPSVRNGNKVSKGDILGKTDTDVTISLFDDSDSRVYIDNFTKREITKTEKLASKGIKSEPTLHYNSAWGRILGDLLITPVKWFEDQYDESGNLKQKRWSSPTEKTQPDDWMAQGSPTYSKKLKEQIEKIKRML